MVDHNRFDELTRTLATSTSRRQALKLLGGGLLAALVPGSAFAKGGNSACAKFCANTFGADTPAAKQCTSDAAKGKGLCYTCGPAAPTNHPPLCGQTCCTTSVANATATCTNGTCGFTCKEGYQECNGTCIPNDQCCGGCDDGQTCQSGVCTIDCCPNIATDVHRTFMTMSDPATTLEQCCANCVSNPACNQWRFNASNGTCVFDVDPTSCSQQTDPANSSLGIFGIVRCAEGCNPSAGIARPSSQAAVLSDQPSFNS